MRVGSELDLDPGEIGKVLYLVFEIVICIGAGLGIVDGNLCLTKPIDLGTYDIIVFQFIQRVFDVCVFDGISISGERVAEEFTCSLEFTLDNRDLNA